MVEVTEPVTTVRLDTPAGLVTARVEVTDGRAREVTLRNVPAFVLRADASVEVPGIGQVTYDMAFGGNFYALVRAASVGVAPYPEQAERLIDVGGRIMDAINVTDPPIHPEDERIAGCRHVVLHEPGRDGADARAATSITRGGSTARRAAPARARGSRSFTPPVSSRSANRSSTNR